MFTKIESPFHSLDLLGRELRRALHAPARRAPRPAWGVPLNVHRSDEAVTVRLAVPGVVLDGVHVDVEGRTLRIRVERPVRELPGRRVLRERPLGDVTRTVDLPAEADTDHVTATLRHGVLDVTVPLRAPRKIEVRTT